MIRAVTRLILFAVICWGARGESVDDAVGALARKVTARMGANEAARVTSRNLTSLSASETVKAQAALDRALRRRLRNPTLVDVSLTISENLHGYLFVAEIRRETGSQFEMEEYRPDPPPVPARPALSLDKRILWEQSAPILDLAIVADQMLLLETGRIARYERNGAKWELKEAFALAGMNVRDPRGRLEISGDSLSAELPGVQCKGTWKPSLAVQCEEGGRFSAGRNTTDFHDWRGAFFNDAEIGDEHVVAEVDGRAHLYDTSHSPAAVFDEWGSELVPVKDSCGGTYLAASAPTDRKSADSIALYSVIDRAPVRMSEPAEFPGPVTALWPTGAGALAVARNLTTGSYAAYALSMDCGR
jgi:hypothetical protein